MRVRLLGYPALIILIRNQERENVQRSCRIPHPHPPFAQLLAAVCSRSVNVGHSEHTFWILCNFALYQQLTEAGKWYQRSRSASHSVDMCEQTKLLFLEIKEEGGGASCSYKIKVNQGKNNSKNIHPANEMIESYIEIKCWWVLINTGRIVLQYSFSHIWLLTKCLLCMILPDCNTNPNYVEALFMATGAESLASLRTKCKEKICLFLCSSGIPSIYGSILLSVCLFLSAKMVKCSSFLLLCWTFYMFGRTCK